MYDEQHTDLPDTVCMRAKASAPPEAPSRTRHVARDRSAQEAPAAAPTPDARTRLLDAAERLFADHGFNGVSTRRLSEAANVNQGSIPYYFGTKHGLFREVFVRRIAGVQEERHARMQALMAASPKPDVVDVLKALLEPAFRHSRDSEHFRRLAGRVATDPTPEVRLILGELYSESSVMIHKTLRAACPDLDEKEFYWRLFCVYGVMLYVQADTGKIQTLAGEDFDTSNPEIALQHALNFVVAGMRAPKGPQPARKRGQSTKR